MNDTRNNTPADVPWRERGLGLAILTRTCGQCLKPRNTSGSVRYVLGEVSMKKTPWTQSEVATLIKTFPHRSGAQVAEQMGRSKAGIECKAKKLHLRKSAEFMCAIYAARAGRPAHVRGAFLADISALLCRPTGAGAAEIIAALGCKTMRATAMLFRAVRAGAVHGAGEGRWMRYFLTPEAAAAGALLMAASRIAPRRAAEQEIVNAERLRRRAEVRQDRDAERAELFRLKAKKKADKAAIPRIRAAAPPKIKAPKDVHNCIAGPLRRARRVDDRPVVIPAHIRVVRGPCNLDKRYTVHTVAEPYFSARPPGQYRDEASAWVPR